VLFRLLRGDTLLSVDSPEPSWLVDPGIVVAGVTLEMCVHQIIAQCVRSRIPATQMDEIIMGSRELLPVRRVALPSPVV
jgi:hypothetical protein